MKCAVGMFPRGHLIPFPIFIERAQGAIMIDINGRELIDFAGGIGVNNVGHSHPKVVAAIKDQADKFIHTCFHVAMYESYVDLAARLNALAPGDFSKMSMFANSGAEAVENAVKIARYAKSRPAVICFENAFHGRTLLTMSLTSKIKPYKLGFGPFAPEIYRMPYAYCYRCPFGLKYPNPAKRPVPIIWKIFSLPTLLPKKLPPVLVEPIQGEGGFVTPPPGIFPQAAEDLSKV